MTDRRQFIQQAGILASAAAIGGLTPSIARAQTAKLRVGMMLPYTGTYAALGTAITQGFNLAVEESGGMVGGRAIEYFTVDDESEPSKATDNANKLVQRDKVDVLIGTVHSGVVMAMVKVARDNGTLLIIPNAGANAATGGQCAPNIFRTSFSNWQPAHPMGKVMYDKGHRKVVTLTWKYGAGEESIESFKEAFTKAGGAIVKEMYLPFPNVEFQPFITEIASLKPDAVFVFFAGGGAVKFTKDYAAAGLKEKIPLYGSGFLTDGTLEAQGASAQGLLTTLHYGDGIENPKNKNSATTTARSTASRPTSMPCRVTTPHCCSTAGSTQSRAASATGRRCTAHWKRSRSTAREGPGRCRRRTIRSRISTCAASRAMRTR